MSTNESIILAGGCFWGVEELIRKLDGVIDTQVGYTGGKSENPIYNEVKLGTTDHAEAVKMIFNPTKISLDEIFEFFFKMHDPTTKNRQGNDLGTQYRSVIFYQDENQKIKALNAIQRATLSGRFKNPIVTEVVAFMKWYDAEDYHQDYLQKNPNGYTCHWIRD